MDNTDNVYKKKKKILLCVDKDQMKPFNYKQPSPVALASMGGNSGNNVFQFGMQKNIISQNVDVDICTTFLTKTDLFLPEIDRINEEYDLLITFPANVIAAGAKEFGLKRWYNAVKRIKKPFHFIGMGAQSDYLYSFDFLDSIREECKNFIGAILDTGGQISLRGYFSAEALKKLGFSDKDYTVTGCPSLFMNGRNLSIQKQHIERKDLKPILNGTHFWFDSKFHIYFQQFPNSIFIDQDVLYRLLLAHHEIPDTITRELPHLRNGLFRTLYDQKRLRIYGDYLAWDEDIKRLKCNFSIGGRIHGNIVSLLAGIPAFIDGHDSRVMELADYFHIPYQHMEKPIDLYEIYSNLDYDKFNKEFSSKYDKFVQFMNGIGVPFAEDRELIDQKVKEIQYIQPPLQFNHGEFIKALTFYAQK